MHFSTSLEVFPMKISGKWKMDHVTLDFITSVFRRLTRLDWKFGEV